MRKFIRTIATCYFLRLVSWAFLWISFIEASHYKSIAMTNNEILHADLLDILFENRNKAYGAYALRKTYNHRLQWSLGISLALTLLMLLFGFNTLKNSSNKTFSDNPGLKLSVIEIPKSKQQVKEEIKPKQKIKIAETTFTNKIKFVAENVKANMPDINQLRNSLISDKTIEGAIPKEIVATNGNSENGDIKSSNNNTEKAFTSHSSEAQFPGGKDAFAKFLSKNLITPDELESGEKKVVLVRFMVDTYGNISKTEILQSDGEKYSKEVLRVLNKMPKWVPAIQNGTKVATWFTQPVTFIGIEQ
jgi:periplasmic protein TonB